VSTVFKLSNAVASQRRLLFYMTTGTKEHFSRPYNAQYIERGTTVALAYTCTSPSVVVCDVIYCG